MITSDQIISIGCCTKPHGIKGEITISLDIDCPISNLSCIILQIEGIFVPFFMESIRNKSHNSFLVKFVGIDTDDEANELSHSKIYVLRSEIADFIESDGDDDVFYLEDFIGYTIIDSPENNLIGTIVGYDDSTENFLFEVESQDGTEILIPAADDFIIEIDECKKHVIMQLPIGLT